MLNNLAKFLLAATSLAPILGAVGVNLYSKGKSWQEWGIWIFTGLLLVILCWLVLIYCSRKIQTEQISIKEFEGEDGETLAFLVAYLLPFISTENLSFSGDWLTGAYILGVIFLVIVHSGAFHFNPLMGLLGYHFYRIKNEGGSPIILLSKRELNSVDLSINCVKLTRNIYMEVVEKSE